MVAGKARQGGRRMMGTAHQETDPAFRQRSAAGRERWSEIGGEKRREQQQAQAQNRSDASQGEQHDADAETQLETNELESSSNNSSPPARTKRCASRLGCSRIAP